VAARKRAGGRRGKIVGAGKAAGAGAGKAAATGRGVAARAGKAGKAGGKPAASRFPEVEELIGLMDRHELLEVDYHVSPDGGRRIRLSRAGTGLAHGHAPAGRATAGAAGAASEASAQGTPAPAAPPAAPVADETVHAFKSPMVGTFYRAPSPEAPPFVSVGDKVDTHGTVCIIEAMKVMNEITPDIAGAVVSIEVENGEAVEFGQTLFLIRPN
jgi:acetyl-CoA carboxylase biotin carboxyl carrier protein